MALLLSHLGRQSTLARHDDARSEDAAGPNAEPEDSSMASFALAFDRRKKRKYSDKHTELFLQPVSIVSIGSGQWTDGLDILAFTGCDTKSMCDLTISLHSAYKVHIICHMITSSVDILA